MNPEFVPLIKYKRSGFYEQEHNGLVVLLNKKGAIKRIGKDNNYPFFQRSCMKPLQAGVLIDNEVDKEFDFSSEEIALATASHAGSQEHMRVVKGLLNKIGLDESYLKCGVQKPLSVDEQKRLIIAQEPYSVFHNNCSGKHTSMLALCLKKGWDLNDYLNNSHPLQQSLIKKTEELCEVKDSPISKDGCSFVTVATTIEDMGKGFLNLFFDEKYVSIKNAFLNHPYLIGGKSRLDSEIINASDGNLVAKVGAGGLCVVVNLDTEECLVVKIADADMKARSIVVINSLLQLGWLDIEKEKAANLCSLYQINISTIIGNIIGRVEFFFEL